MNRVTGRRGTTGFTALFDIPLSDHYFKKHRPGFVRSLNEQPSMLQLRTVATRWTQSTELQTNVTHPSVAVGD
ncbi:hypothetical protein GN244_ATG13151 [Phytophthora infestans]|uniref:Uncharacterized protein n=1 Tax=Phytophthora infestans TaxID=4787 RepID=A0A833VZ08_PHYIN|nr:hypothetical protein GN244_ATG13151 [Phytophthora infestans]